jgi:hypothetical protein
MDLVLLLTQLERCTLLQALDRLHQIRYTGPITLHFQNGTPKVIEAIEAHRVGLQDLRAPACLTAPEEIAQTS